MNKKNTILETYLMPDGFTVDLNEGFRKLTERQFGGKPGRAFNELIQNAIDSYPRGTPWNDRIGEIETGEDWISIKDFGEGMHTERLKLLITLGGTDKYDDPSKIGQFGMGFMAMFNPKLGTRKIEVITRCEGEFVQLIFDVSETGKLPVIHLDVIDRSFDFSTMIKTTFDFSHSLYDCLESAKDALAFYPCRFRINGKQLVSVWSHNNSDSCMEFSENGVHGLIRKDFTRDNVSVLCKYERIYNTTLNHFITGGHNAYYDLRDFQKTRTPFLPGISLILNIDNLRVTISRDSYYLDWAWSQALSIMNSYLKGFLLKSFEKSKAHELVLANQYIFCNEISSYLKYPDSNLSQAADERKLIASLASFPVYRINGRSGLWSLSELLNMKNRELPLFYSPFKNNMRWLGGAFKHDFIVIPETCHLNGGASDFYDNLFQTIFGDVVNLDTIRSNNKLITELVNRKIISKSALTPSTKIIGEKYLNPGEKELLNDLEVLLSDQSVLEVIEKTLHMRIKRIKPVFFTLEEKGIRISTGLFDEKGTAVNDEFVSNFLISKDEDPESFNRKNRATLLLGLCSDHPFLRYLVNHKSNQRNYYTLTYLAHELALCQRILVPYSPFYHQVKQKLAMDMRNALMKMLLASIKN